MYEASDVGPIPGELLAELLGPGNEREDGALSYEGIVYGSTCYFRNNFARVCLSEDEREKSDSIIMIKDIFTRIFDRRPTISYRQLFRPSETTRRPRGPIRPYSSIYENELFFSIDADDEIYAEQLVENISVFFSTHGMLDVISNIQSENSYYFVQNIYHSQSCTLQHVDDLKPDDEAYSIVKSEIERTKSFLIREEFLDETAEIEEDEKQIQAIKKLPIEEKRMLEKKKVVEDDTTNDAKTASLFDGALELSISCAVCQLDDNLPNSSFAQCTSCKVYVHKACAKIPEEQDSWVCIPCQVDVNPSDLSCIFCSLSGGALTRNDHGKWAHFSCIAAFPSSKVVGDEKAGVQSVVNVVESSNATVPFDVVVPSIDAAGQKSIETIVENSDTAVRSSDTAAPSIEVVVPSIDAAGQSSDASVLSSSLGLENLLDEMLQDICEVCLLSGSCIECSFPGCTQRCHVLCAQENRLSISKNAKGDDIFYCTIHSLDEKILSSESQEEKPQLSKNLHKNTNLHTDKNLHKELDKLICSLLPKTQFEKLVKKYQKTKLSRKVDATTLNEKIRREKKKLKKTPVVDKENTKTLALNAKEKEKKLTNIPQRNEKKISGQVQQPKQKVMEKLLQKKQVVENSTLERNSALSEELEKNILASKNRNISTQQIEKGMKTIEGSQLMHDKQQLTREEFMELDIASKVINSEDKGKHVQTREDQTMRSSNTNFSRANSFNNDMKPIHMMNSFTIPKKPVVKVPSLEEEGIVPKPSFRDAYHLPQNLSRITDPVVQLLRTIEDLKTRHYNLIKNTDSNDHLKKSLVKEWIEAEKETTDDLRSSSLENERSKYKSKEEYKGRRSDRFILENKPQPVHRRRVLDHERSNNKYPYESNDSRNNNTSKNEDRSSSRGRIFLSTGNNSLNSGKSMRNSSNLFIKRRHERDKKKRFNSRK